MVALSTKIAGPTYTANTIANTVSGATIIRVLNTNAGLATLTVANNGVNTGTITLLANNIEYITKYSSDTVVSNTTSGVLCTPVAFSW